MKKIIYLLLIIIVLLTACSKEEAKEIIVDEKYTNYSELDNKISYSSKISKDNKLFVFLMNNNDIDVDIDLLVVSGDLKINQIVYSIAAKSEYVFLAESKDIKEYSIYFDTIEAESESILKDVVIEQSAGKDSLEIIFKNTSDQTIDKAIWTVIYYRGKTIVAHDFLILNNLGASKETLIESPYPQRINTFDYFDIVPIAQ